jgi:hypothetical protein
MEQVNHPVNYNFGQAVSQGSNPLDSNEDRPLASANRIRFRSDRIGFARTRFQWRESKIGFEVIIFASNEVVGSFVGSENDFKVIIFDNNETSRAFVEVKSVSQ